jgi:hypothetical protein
MIRREIALAARRGLDSAAAAPSFAAMRVSFGAEGSFRSFDPCLSRSADPARLDGAGFMRSIRRVLILRIGVSVSKSRIVKEPRAIHAPGCL